MGQVPAAGRRSLRTVPRNFPGRSGGTDDAVYLCGPETAAASALAGDHAIVGGRNYGQGSSREQAALAPRSLGLRLVIARSIARIHAENLVNFGILPLTLGAEGDKGKLQPGTTIRLSGLRKALGDSPGELDVQADGNTIRCQHALSPRQVDVLFAGGGIPWKRRQLGQARS